VSQPVLMVVKPESLCWVAGRRLDEPVTGAECVNSVLRMHRAGHRKLSQGLLDLKRLYWNCQVFRTGRPPLRGPWAGPEAPGQGDSSHSQGEKGYETGTGCLKGKTIAREDEMAKTMLIVTDPDKRARIPQLLEKAGISFTQSERGGQVNYFCKEGEAEVWVLAGPKQSLPGEKRVDFYPVFINPKQGFFRGWFKGKVDRQLQEKAEKALEPIKDLTLVMK
jgi:hypothetical protein